MVWEAVQISFFYMELSSFHSISQNFPRIEETVFIVYSCLICHQLIDQMHMGLFLGFPSCFIDLYFYFFLFWGQNYPVLISVDL